MSELFIAAQAFDQEVGCVRYRAVLKIKLCVEFSEVNVGNTPAFSWPKNLSHGNEKLLADPLTTKSFLDLHASKNNKAILFDKPDHTDQYPLQPGANHGIARLELAAVSGSFVARSDLSVLILLNESDID